MFLKDYLKSRKSYIPANSQTKELPVVLLQEFQNLIRKHFHVSLSSNPKWKELDKRNVDLKFLCHQYFFFFFLQIVYIHTKKIRQTSELLNSTVAVLCSWFMLQLFTKFTEINRFWGGQITKKELITYFSVQGSVQSLKQSSYAYL